MAITRVIISVSDKSGLENLAGGLVALGVEILSTGGTARSLRESNLPVTDVSNYTGFPEMLGGRVKTLHPAVHGGILYRRDNHDDLAQMKAQNFGPIDMVVVNLYPFAATIAKPGVAFAEAIENIDIGGPCLLRAAAKNHAFVTVLTDPADYRPVLDEIKANQGNTKPDTRRRLAQKAFAATSAYDQMIADYLAGQGCRENKI